MKRIGLWLFTLWGWTVVSTGFVVHYVVAALLMHCFVDKAYGHMRLTRPFIWLGFRLCGIRVKVQGLENIPRDRNFIIFSNHQSLLDILVFVLVIPYKFSFIAKEELLKVPILGSDIRMQGHFSVNRGSRHEATAVIESVKKAMLEGRSILTFPEGTRSIDQTILPFKGGVFHLPIETGVPVIPCYINGTNQIIRKKSLMTHPGSIDVSFGAAIEIPKPEKPLTPVVRRQQVQDLSKETRERIIQLFS